MPIRYTLGPYHSEDLLSPYDVANALNQLDTKAGTGSGPITALDIDTTDGTPGPTTFLAGDNTWKVPAGGGGGGTFNLSGSADPGLTVTQLKMANFSDAPDHLMATGYYNPFDYGNAYYIAVDEFTTPLGTKLINPSRNEHVGAFTTADGTKYQMAPDGNLVVNVAAFGAQSRQQFDFSHDNWQAFQDCKFWLKGLYDPDTQHGFDMRIPPGTFFLSRPHSIEGVPYSLIGAGRNSTMLRFPWNQSGLQVQHAYGGQGQTIGSEGVFLVAGGNYTLGNIGYPIGSTRVYVCTTAGHLGDAMPTGTGTGITTSGGTAVWAYLRDLEYSEIGYVGGGFGSISSMTLWSTANGRDITQYIASEDQTQVDGAYWSGVVMRERMELKHFWAASFLGHGIAIVSDGDPEVRGSGNVNQWRLDRIASYWNGHDGVHVGLADANAGIGIDVDVASNLRFGVFDASFLGNRWVSVQAAYDGTSGAGAHYPGMCTHNGYIWMARVPGIGGDPVANYANEPGTDANSWMRVAGDGQFAPSTDAPVWNPAIRFVPSGAYCSNNINSRTQWYGLYIEGGTNPPQFSGPNSIWGGIGIGSSGHGEFVYDDSGNFNSAVKVSVRWNGADGQDGVSCNFGPNTIDGGSHQNADASIFRFNGGGNNSIGLAGVITTNPPTITGSIADVVANSASFTGQIGVGDAVGDNVWQNILFVTSIASGAIVAGQTISGAGIAAGTVIGNPSWWTNSWNILPGDGVGIGTNGTGAGGITSEAMTSQTIMPVLTVTVCPPDAISLGATLQGGGLPYNPIYIQIAKQLNPSTLANIPFTGGVGKYALSKVGNTVASTTFSVWPNGMKNLDFGLTAADDAGTHVWGWTGRDSKRKFGRVNPIKNAFFATKLVLGSSQRGMDDGESRVVQMTGGTPDNGGDYKTGEYRFNYNFGGGAGTAWGWVFLGAETGITGTPKWFPLGTVS